jgi:1-acyl-sn-glycerol-3-phosphate acyltransferase
MSDEWRRSAWVRRAVHWALYWWFRVVHGLRVEGLENLPEEGACIVAGGPHVSYLDIVMPLAGGPKRVMRGLIKAEVFTIPVVGWFLRKAWSIPLDRKGGIAGLRAAIDALEHQGGCVAIFPEGTRSKTGAPGRAKAGVGYIASRSGAPVVLCKLEGMWGYPFTRRVVVRFGPSVRFEKKDADIAECQAFAQSVLDGALSL